MIHNSDFDLPRHGFYSDELIGGSSAEATRTQSHASEPDDLIGESQPKTSHLKERMEMASDGGSADNGASAEEDLATLARTARKSSARCTFLSRALSDEKVTLELISALRSNPPHTGTDIDAFASSLRTHGRENADEKLPIAIQTVIEDHDNIFTSRGAVSGSCHGSVSPLETDNLDGIDPDVVLNSVKEAYRLQNFDPQKSRYVPSAETPVDHICVEMCFLASLSDRCADEVERALSGEFDNDPEALMQTLYNAESALNDRYTFLEDHLVVWVAGFCNRLEDAASTNFYKGVAQMLRQLITEEREYLDVLDSTAEL